MRQCDVDKSFLSGRLHTGQIVGVVWPVVFRVDLLDCCFERCRVGDGLAWGVNLVHGVSLKQNSNA